MSEVGILCLRRSVTDEDINSVCLFNTMIRVLLFNHLLVDQ